MTNIAYIKRLVRYALKHKVVLMGSVLAMVSVAALEPLVAALLKPLIDENFSKASDVNPLKIPLLLLAGFFFKGIGGASAQPTTETQWKE